MELLNTSYIKVALTVIYVFIMYISLSAYERKRKKKKLYPLILNKLLRDNFFINFKLYSLKHYKKIFEYKNESIYQSPAGLLFLVINNLKPEHIDLKEDGIEYLKKHIDITLISKEQAKNRVFQIHKDKVAAFLSKLNEDEIKEIRELVNSCDNKCVTIDERYHKG